MATSNAERARLLTELWNEGMRAVPAGCVTSDVEIDSPLASVRGSSYHGHAGAEQWVRDIDEQFDEWRLHVEEIHEVGATVLVVGRLRGRGRGSGVQLDQAYATALEFTPAQRVSRVTIYWDVDAAREAHGIAG